ncbi:50S ribosomal protein L17 [Candidatus Gottesmanbacteria bacterium]|nr:50S ribosomal protein L17 [Candidatus Gottesmanbacteria bacterium]
MRHSVFGRKLSRTKNERRRLLQILARDLIHRGSIHTTLAKAKAVVPLVEKLVTSAKHGGIRAKIAPKRVLSDKETEKLLITDAATRFAPRQSGFTRIVKLGPRSGDAAEEVLLQFVDERVVVEVVKSPDQVKEKEPVEKEKRGRPKKSASIS